MKCFFGWGVLMLAILCAGGALAGDLSVGVKAGAVNYDLSPSSAGTGGSAVIGYRIFDMGAARLSIEGEISRSLEEGEIFNRTVKFGSQGAYLALRTAGPLFFTGRIGVVNAEIEPVGDETGASAGVGIGFNVLGLNWALDYTRFEVLDIDVDYISMGISF